MEEDCGSSEGKVLWDDGKDKDVREIWEEGVYKRTGGGNCEEIE